MLKLRAIISAAALMFSALANAQDINASQADRLVSIGDAFVQAGNFEKAEGLFQEALSAAADNNEVWTAASKLANLYNAIEKYNNALDVYDMLLLNPSVQRDSVMLMYVYGGAGCVYYHLADYVKSIKCFDRARSYLEDNGETEYKPMLYCNMARTLVKAGNLDVAESMLDEAQEACASSQLDELVEIYQIKAMLYETLGDYRKAFENMVLHSDLHHMVWKQDKNELLNASSPVQRQQKTENIVRYEKKIRELESLVSIERGNAKRSGFVAYFGSLALLTLVCVLIWLAVINRRRKRLINELTHSTNMRLQLVSNVGARFYEPIKSLVDYTAINVNYAESQGDEWLAEFSKRMNGAAHDVMHMVGNTVNWTQIGSRYASAHPEVVSVSEAIEEIVERFHSLSRLRNIFVSVAIDDNVEAYVDKSHLFVILSNMLSNAILYTEEGGRVMVSAVEASGKVSVTVDDSGRGISDKVVACVMNPESRELGNIEHKGLGLGLIICRDMAKLNKGRLDIKSADGVGTTVTLVLDSNRKH